MTLFVSQEGEGSVGALRHEAEGNGYDAGARPRNSIINGTTGHTADMYQFLDSSQLLNMRQKTATTPNQ